MPLSKSSPSSSLSKRKLSCRPFTAFSLSIGFLPAALAVAPPTTKRPQSIRQIKSVIFFILHLRSKSAIILNLTKSFNPGRNNIFTLCFNHFNQTIKYFRRNSFVVRICYHSPFALSYPYFGCICMWHSIGNMHMNRLQRQSFIRPKIYSIGPKSKQLRHLIETLQFANI